MSGGTDSSVAAILLLEQGYEVIGITFRFWEEGENKHLRDAQRLADQLGIQHISYDARESFRNTVVKYFVDEYLAGRTPFPCVICNNELKWKLILEEADRLACEKVAMGHYATIISESNHYFIAEGVDHEKDQSFFLWGLRQEQLARIVFPLGRLLKSEVRTLAARKGFEKISLKKDSLGACFCLGDYRPFLKNQCKEPDLVIYPGNFIDEQGNVLGRHEGYPFYTVGQRHGLIYLNRKVYVKEIRSYSNEVVLASREGMYKTEFFIHNMNVVDQNLFSESMDISCRIRYRKQNTRCRLLFLGNNSAKVELSEALDAISPGQTAVFYKGAKVIGGGFIE
jgi:tRNA-specific 2-thiouridylase